MCFGAKGNSFGSFLSPKTGRLAAIKLVHLYGYVSCDVASASYWSFWGCGGNPWNGINKLVNILIASASNHILIPEGKLDMNVHGLKWSKIPGYNSESPEIVLSAFNPHWMVSRQRLRLWYGEDLLNRSVGNNGGKVCCKVYALFV